MSETTKQMRAILSFEFQNIDVQAFQAIRVSIEKLEKEHNLNILVKDFNTIPSDYNDICDHRVKVHNNNGNLTTYCVKCGDVFN